MIMLIRPGIWGHVNGVLDRGPLYIDYMCFWTSALGHWELASNTNLRQPNNYEKHHEWTHESKDIWEGQVKAATARVSFGPICSFLCYVYPPPRLSTTNEMLVRSPAGCTHLSAGHQSWPAVGPTCSTSSRSLLSAGQAFTRRSLKPHYDPRNWLIITNCSTVSKSGWAN